MGWQTITEPDMDYARPPINFLKHHGRRGLPRRPWDLLALLIDFSKRVKGYNSISLTFLCLCTPAHGGRQSCLTNKGAPPARN